MKVFLISVHVIMLLCFATASTNEGADEAKDVGQPKRFIDCFPKKAQVLFERRIPPPVSDPKGLQIGRELADAVGNSEELCMAVCRALGTLVGQDSSWSMVSQKEFLALAGARTVEAQSVLKAFERLKEDRQGLLGAARLFYFEKFGEKIPDQVRADWHVRLAQVVLTDGWDGNKSLVLRQLGNDASTKTRDLLRDVFAGKIGKEIDNKAAWFDEPGVRAEAALGLAMRGDKTIKAEVTKRVAGMDSKSDVAAYEICLALLGDPEKIKVEHFRLRSYSIGLAGLAAIERFKDKRAMEALARGAISHPWTRVRDEAKMTFTRITGQTMSFGEILDWYEETYEGKRRTESLATFRGDKGSLRAVRFSPDGKSIAVGSTDRIARIWNITSGAKLALHGHTFTVMDAAFSPDGKFIATASGDKTVRVWDALSGETQRVLSGHAHFVNSVAYSPDGKLLVSVSEDGTAVVWDTQSGERKTTFRGHANHGVTAAVFRPNGKTVASCGTDQAMRFWDPITGAEQKVVLGDKNVRMTGIAFSPDGLKIAVSLGDAKTVRVYSTETGNPLLTLLGHTNWVSSAAFAPDGKMIASTGWDKTVRLWDAQSGKELHAFKAHPESINRVVFSPDGKLLATSSLDRSAKIWEISRLLSAGAEKQ